MTTWLINQHIVEGTNKMDDKKILRANNLSVTKIVSENSFEPTVELKTYLDKRKSKLKNGASKAYPWQSLTKEIWLYCIIILLISCEKNA